MLQSTSPDVNSTAKNTSLPEQHSVQELAVLRGAIKGGQGIIEPSRSSRDPQHV